MAVEPDHHRLAEYEAIPRCLLLAYGLLCGCVIVAAIAVGGRALAGQPWWVNVGYAMLLVAAVLGAAWVAFPLLAAVVRRWPALRHDEGKR